MARINYAELRKMHDGLSKEDREDEFYSNIAESLKTQELKVSDFSIRELAEAFLSDAAIRAMAPGTGGVELLEDGAGISTTAFGNITGQLMYSAILAGYEQAGFVGDQLCTNQPTKLSGEKIPGIAKLGDVSTPIIENGLYPHAGVGEEWIETPETTKHGIIVPVTKEAIFFDRTGLLVDRANSVGEALGLRKEKQIIDTVFGIINNHSWNGTAYDTYQATTPWVNLRSDADYALVDYTDINEAELLFEDMTDPNTGEPILIGGKTLLVCGALNYTARRIVNTTEIRQGAISATVPLNVSSNPVMGITPLTSPFFKARLVASGVSAANAITYWGLGDYKKAFKYMENWPITVTQAPSNSEAEFNQDIVLRFKASERGVAACVEPRFVLLNKGHD